MSAFNPAFDYESYKGVYNNYRKADPRIEAQIFEQLEGMESLVNVGAGAGSYEPEHIPVTAVEPSESMRKLRISAGKAPAIDSFAEDLPFPDNSFDASLASITIHHWKDQEKGLKELKRVSRKRILIMTFDPEEFHKIWYAHTFAEVVAAESQRFKTIPFIEEVLEQKAEIIPIRIYPDCTDGFMDAYYSQPERFLEPQVRMNQSAWGFLPEGMEEVLVERFRHELETGEWDKHFGHFRDLSFYEGALKLLVFNL